MIRGQVTVAEQPAPRVLVGAFYRHLRQEPLLGTATTDGGRYEIPCEVPQLARPTRDTLDVVVRVFRRDVTEAPLAESRARVTRSGEAVVDLRLPEPAVSEWDRIVAAVLPLLADQGEGGQPLEPWQLNDDDVEVIAEDAGVGREQLRVWVRAARAVHEEPIGTAPEPQRARPDLATLQSMAVYGWFREGSPESLEDLLRRPSDDLLASLERAAAQSWIPALDKSGRDRLRASLDAGRVDRALRPAKAGAASLGDALRLIPGADRLELDAPDSAGRRLATSLVLAAAAGQEPDWGKIREIVRDEELLAATERSIRLRTLTGGHAPLMEELQSRAAGSDAATLADSVSMERTDWLALVEAHGVPDDVEGVTEDARQRLYVQQLARTVERMHPTPFIRQRIASDRIPVRGELKAPIDAFLAANPALRFKETPVLVYLSSDAVDTGGLTEDQIAGITPTLLTLERVARIAPALEYVAPLLSNGYESARDVVRRHSREVFADDVRDTIDADEAARIYDAAAGVVATTEALVLMRSPRFAGQNLPVMPLVRGSSEALSITDEGVGSGNLIQPANLQQLFGNQDYCECGHGASLYGPGGVSGGPAADADRGPRLNDKTALQVLLAAPAGSRGSRSHRRQRRHHIAVYRPGAGDPRGAGLGRRSRIPGPPRRDAAKPEQRLRRRARSGRGSRPARRRPRDLGAPAERAREAPCAERTCRTAAGATFRSWLIRDQQSGLKLRLLGVIPGAYRVRGYPQSVAGMPGGYRPWSRILSSTATSASKARFPWACPSTSRETKPTRGLPISARREKRRCSPLRAPLDGPTSMQPASA